MVSYFATRQTEILHTIQALVTHETPSSDKARLDAFADLLVGRLTAAGASSEVIASAEAGNHVRARFGAEQSHGETKQALLLCHYDTVWPLGALETHPFRIEGGRAYGPGILDMKSSLALVEYMLRALGEMRLTLPRPLTILVTSDEEVGSRSSRSLIEEEARRSAFVLVLEPPLPGGALKTARKGIGQFVLEITGRAAHAGVEPKKGVSAIHELALQILELHALNDSAKEVTVNVGVVQGGTAPNVVAAKATAAIDVRAWTQEEAKRLGVAILGLTPVTPGAALHIGGGWNRPPLERRVTGQLFERARIIGRNLGLELTEGATGGGSDGNFTGALGIPTLDGLGMPGAGAHADHEHIEVDQIAGRAALLTALLRKL